VERCCDKQYERRVKELQYQRKLKVGWPSRDVPVTRRKEVVTTGLRFENGTRPWGSSGETDSFSIAETSAESEFGLPDTTKASQVLTSETVMPLAASSFSFLFVPATIASSASGLSPSTASIGEAPLPPVWFRIVWHRVPCQNRYVIYARAED
jgi:hypothetical protein